VCAAVASDHPDRLRWNARYDSANRPDFAAHPLVSAAVAAGLPDGPVLELACGRSGSALALAAAERTVTAVDISDVALDALAAEASRRGLAHRVECVLADAPSYPIATDRYALVLATFYWDGDAFRAACAAVRPGGLLGWEALAAPAGGEDAGPFRVRHGELGSRLPAGFDILDEHQPDERSSRLLARRLS
jgi:SAM-dependent methyltransferase